MRQPLTYLILISSFIFLSYTEIRENGYKITKVVIDAGHGGHDTGCLGSSSKEKDIALSIALKLGKFIENNFTDVKVIYTRTSDIFVELHQRAAIANNNKADVFICIHCNSGPREAYGTETFVMGLHKSEDNLNVAKRENASILMEENYQAKYEGFDPNSPEAYIIFSLYQNAFLTQSLNLASKVQHQFKEKVARYSRGVKQAGFLVLYRTTMPSVLIETGFLTNRSEESYMSSEKGQNELAFAIYKAFQDYKNEIEGVFVKNDKGLENKTRDSLKKENILADKNIFENNIKKIDLSDNKPKDTFPIKPIDLSGNFIVFKVQIATASLHKPLSKESEIFKKLDMKIDTYNNVPDATLKYTVGSYSDIDDAINLQNKVRNQGFKDAFVVAFKNGERISIQEARSLLIKKN